MGNGKDIIASVLGSLPWCLEDRLSITSVLPVLFS